MNSKNVKRGGSTEHSICSTPKTRNEFHDGCIRVTPICVVPKAGGRRRKGGDEILKTEKRALDGKTVVKLYTHEGVREMIIPSKEKNYYPVQLSHSEFGRLQEQAVIVSEKEKLIHCKKEEERLKQVAEDSRMRKVKLQSFVVKGGVPLPPKLAALEENARDMANYLQKRAWIMRQEASDDVQQASAMMLRIKCKSIRDDQVDINKFLREEEKKEKARVEDMLEDLRTRTYAKDLNELAEKRRKRQEYIDALNEQYADLIAERLIEKEKKEQDQKRAQEITYLVLNEERERFLKEAREQAQLRKELNEANEAIIKGKEREKVEDVIANLRMEEYQALMDRRKQAEEDAKMERLKKAANEVARLQTLQAGLGNAEGDKEEAIILRRQEQYEREIRKKEKEARAWRRRIDEELRQGLDEQVANNWAEAMTIQKDKVDEEYVLRKMKEQMEVERLLEIRRRYEKEEYRQDLLKQMNEEEQREIDKICDKLVEGMQARAAIGDRTKEFKEIMDIKIENLRREKVPEKFIAEILNNLGYECTKQ